MEKRNNNNQIIILIFNILRNAINMEINIKTLNRKVFKIALNEESERQTTNHNN